MQDRSRTQRHLPDGNDQGPNGAVNKHHLNPLLARWKHGSDEAAAAYLGMSRHTLKNLLYDLRTRIGVGDTTQATYLLRDALLRLDDAPEGG